MKTDMQKAQILGIIARCPVTKDDPEKCPLGDVRKMSFPEQIEWLQSRKRSEIKAMLEHHRECQKKRSATLKI
jgi:hypothetical protein